LEKTPSKPYSKSLGLTSPSAQLNMDKVAKFQDKYNEFAKMKKKKLLEAIEIANKIVKGETTFKGEYISLKYAKILHS
jgi:hypothetical protein